MYICYGPSYSWRPVYFLVDLLKKYGQSHVRLNESNKNPMSKIITRIPSYIIKNTLKAVSDKFEYNFAKYIRGALNSERTWNPLFFKTTCKIDIKRFKLDKKTLTVPAEIIISGVKGESINLRSVLIKKAIKSTNYVVDIYTMEEREGEVRITARIVMAEL